jgi:hypothetical protein
MIPKSPPPDLIRGWRLSGQIMLGRRTWTPLGVENFPDLAAVVYRLRSGGRAIVPRGAIG